MQTANSWTRESNVDNNFLYNGGTELNKTTQVYDLYYRNYDPVLGRFGQVDPMAGKYGPLSPYHFAGNNPVVLNDPMGDDFDSDNQFWDELVGTSYMAGGRGYSVYRDFDPLGRRTGARLLAQAFESWGKIKTAQFLSGLLESPGIYSQAWNGTPDSPTGTSAGVFYIKDGQIDGYATWACNSGSATSEEQLAAQSGWGGGYGDEIGEASEVQTQTSLPTPEELEERFGASFIQSFVNPLKAKFENSMITPIDLKNHIEGFDFEGTLVDTQNEYRIKPVFGRLVVGTPENPSFNETLFNVPTFQQLKGPNGVVLNPGTSTIRFMDGLGNYVGIVIRFNVIIPH